MRHMLNTWRLTLAIARVGIIWQTKARNDNSDSGCIGDNSDPNNPVVWYDSAKKKIYVKTRPEKEGVCETAAMR